MYHRAYQSLIDREELARTIKARRAYFGINQVELSRIAGLHRNAISAIETGKQASLAAVVLVLDALDLSCTVTIEPIQDRDLDAKIKRMRVAPIIRTVAHALGHGRITPQEAANYATSH